MTHHTLTCAVKLLALQVLAEAALLAAGTSLKESSLIVAALSVFAPLYFRSAHQLYRSAFAAILP